MAITKQTILDDIQLYSAEDLYQFILDGVVTFDQLKNESDGNLAPKVRMRIQELLNGGEEEAWGRTLQVDSASAYQSFISSYPQSRHCPEAHGRIKELQSIVAGEQSSRIWNDLDKNNLDALKGFVAQYPDDVHAKDARSRINQLEWELLHPYGRQEFVKELNQIETDLLILNKTDAVIALIKDRIDNGKITRDDLKAMIAEDHNVFSSAVVYNLIQEGLIGYDDLFSMGIKSEFIQYLADQKSSAVLPFTQPIVKINKVSTEIYFWGIPSSGKTCAIGGILNVAGNGEVALNMVRDNDCQGYGYMTRLPKMFKADGISVLPEGTPVYATYEMGFDLIDKQMKSHPITFIDLAGELVRCMYKQSAGEPMSDDDELALDTLTRILIDNRSINRKVHFFVIEYGGEKREYEGLAQEVYLDAALRYIERTRIFENDTDAVFLIVTKVDITGKSGEALKQELTDYIKSTHYRDFYQGLKLLCQKYQINGGEVEILPFSLGEVCFQNYCMFDKRPSASVVKKIIERSKGFGSNKLINAIKK